MELDGGCNNIGIKIYLMKYYIIAGEASGDLHASNLMREIIKKDEKALFRFWGGDKMKQVAGQMVKHYRELAFMGFWEVAKNITEIISNINLCKKDIDEFRPDKIIFVDYPGFNLKIAGWAKKKGYQTIYYICPQLWAWKEARVEQMRKNIDKIIVILPFEKEFYRKHNLEAHFVGHPLLDMQEIGKRQNRDKFIEENNLENKPIIALLPGSRIQEIEKMLSVMLSVVDDFKDYQFVVAGAPSIDKEFYNRFIRQERVHFVSGKTYGLLGVSQAALVTSGTATLETAILKVPEVVCYKSSPLSYWIAKQVVGDKLKYISLVNLIMDREVVKELIQGDLTRENLKKELEKILTQRKREEIDSMYRELEGRLGGGGASKRAAEIVVE